MDTRGVITIIDVTDEATFGRIPPCADPGFDHRSCDYWEDADRGTKAVRLAWLEPPRAAAEPAPRPPLASPATTRSSRISRRSADNPFALAGPGGDAIVNPFVDRGRWP